MGKNYGKQVAKLERQQTRIESKLETMKARYARSLINEARAILGKPKLGTKRVAKTARTSKGTGPTFGGKKADGK